PGPRGRCQTGSLGPRVNSLVMRIVKEFTQNIGCSDRRYHKIWYTFRLTGVRQVVVQEPPISRFSGEESETEIAGPRQQGRRRVGRRFARGPERTHDLLEVPDE